MDNSFDDLFNEFLGGELNNNNNAKPSKLNNIGDSIDKVIKAIADNLDNNLEMSNGFDERLGEPSEVRYYEEDGLYFIESIWETEIGVIKKTIVSDTPLDGSEKIEEQIELTLEEQLEEAVQKEEYEKAAKLRDSIKKQKKVKKKL
jgi:excinuclease UvrABC helicase subunit UvrB